MKVRLRAVLAAFLLLLLLPGAALAAPTSGQIDFVSRMSENGYIVEQGGFVFYVHNGAIWRMNTGGGGQRKQYVMNAPFDLQNHGGAVYFIDRKDTAYSLYRFYPGDASPTLLRTNVFDAIIGGNVLYYTNKAGTRINAWNLSSDEDVRIYDGSFTGARGLNYMQNLLVFTAKLPGASAENLFLYSPDKNHSTYYEGLTSDGLMAQGSYLYMPYEGGLTRLRFTTAQPSLTLNKTVVKNAERFFIAGDSYYYWKESGNAVTIQKRNIATGAETKFFSFDKTELRNATLQPTASAIWVYTQDKDGAYYKQRLAR